MPVCRETNHFCRPIKNTIRSGETSTTKICFMHDHRVVTASDRLWPTVTFPSAFRQWLHFAWEVVIIVYLLYLNPEGCSLGVFYGPDTSCSPIKFGPDRQRAPSRHHHCSRIGNLQPEMREHVMMCKTTVRWEGWRTCTCFGKCCLMALEWNQLGPSVFWMAEEPGYSECRGLMSVIIKFIYIFFIFTVCTGSRFSGLYLERGS
jgi:hypothetical protein